MSDRTRDPLWYLRARVLSELESQANAAAWLAKAEERNAEQLRAFKGRLERMCSRCLYYDGANSDEVYHALHQLHTHLPEIRRKELRGAYFQTIYEAERKFNKDLQQIRQRQARQRPREV
jgi:hypothetical protein